jgi:predicted dehydrogenase
MKPRADQFPASPTPTSRRSFLGDVGRVAGVGATVTAAVRATGLGNAHAAGSEEIRLAVVGCGGRGSGAVRDAIQGAKAAPVKLVAAADIFKERIDGLKRTLAEQFGDRIDVPEERAFVGVEAFRQAIEALRPGDILILTTPPAFRAVHFAAAIDKGLNVFMEKPVSIDGPSTNRMLALAKRADEKNLKVGVGLMCRHCEARKQLLDRLRNGEAGDLLLFRGYRMHPAYSNMDLAPGPPELARGPDGRVTNSELLWQAKRFHNFLWASGGIFSDYYIHQIDEACWMKGAWPQKAEAVGGRHFHGKLDDQNFDSYAVEYTFADGTKFQYTGRHMPNTYQRFELHGMGSKGAFTISIGHHPAKPAIYKSQRMDKANILWSGEHPEPPHPYRLEWQHLVEAIVNNQPYNEVVRGAEASLVTAMGRAAAHTGRVITYDEMLASPDDLTAGVDALKDDSPAPLQRGADGSYPVPMPGRFKFEYRG